LQQERRQTITNPGQLDRPVGSARRIGQLDRREGSAQSGAIVHVDKSGESRHPVTRTRKSASYRLPESPLEATAVASRIRREFGETGDP